MHKYTRIYMGTFFTIIIDDDVNENIISKVFLEISRIEKIFSKYLPDSEVSIFNKIGVVKGASIDFLYVLRKAIFYAELSGGKYNPCILPLLEYYSSIKDESEVSREEIEKLLSLTDYKKIVIDEQTKTVQSRTPGLKIDLSSIAKGYAIDKAIEKLVEAGINHALVEGGGDIRVLDGKKDNDYWYIGIRDPFSNNFKKVLKLKNKSIATSGIYERFLDSNKRFTHVVDGTTGQTISDVASATVITENAIDADAIATMLLVMGVEGLMLVEKHRLGEAYLILSNREEFMTKNFEEFIER